MGTWLARLAGLILILLGLPVALMGLTFLLYGIVFFSLEPCAGPTPCRSVGPAVPLLGAAVIAIAVVHWLVGVGVILGGRRAQIIGLLISGIGTAYAAYGALTIRTVAYVFSEQGERTPRYNTDPLLAAASVILYGIVFLILLLRARNKLGVQPSSGA